MDVSVVIPTLNEQDYLADCLRSLTEQKGDLEYEIIVSDGKSSDDTLEIATKYADSIVTSRERGIGLQRNKGAEVATGRYLVFIDADTCVPEDYLQKVIKKFESDPELAAFSACFRFSSDDEKIAFSQKVTNAYLEFRDKRGSAILLGFNLCVRKDVFWMIGGFRDVPIEDAEFGYRIRQIKKTAFFTDFYVTTSSRRLEQMGILSTLRYYFEMDLATRSPALRKLLTYEEYVPIRGQKKKLRKEFNRLFHPEAVSIDVSVKDYIDSEVNELSNLLSSTKKQAQEGITRVSESLADIKLIHEVGKKEVDHAIGLLKERIDSRRS